MKLKILWDEPKRVANLVKHGLDFVDLNEFFFDNALVLPSYGKRWRGVGKTIRRRGGGGVRYLGQRSGQRHQHATGQQR